MKKKFIDWLQKEIAEQRLTATELAHRADLYPSTVTRLLNFERDATPDTLAAIARALKIPAEEIFRRAGLLPDLPAPEDDATLRELMEMVQRYVHFVEADAAKSHAGADPADNWHV
jgi:transcriptional regulator with XRE-family HTH domain